MGCSMKKKNSLIVSSSIVFVLTTFGSCLNYICQILMGRFFSVENYGVINTIFSWTLIVTVIGNTAFMLLSKNISKNKNNGFNIYNYLMKLVNISSIITVIVCLLASPVLYKMVDHNIITFILMVICLVTSIYPILYQGVFGGVNKFTVLGIYTLIVPIIKLLGVVAIWLLGIHGNNELYVVLMAIIIGNVFSIAVGMLFSKKYLGNKKSMLSTENIKTEYINILVINGLLMFTMNADILSLSYLYNSNMVGLYSSVLIFGKVIYYFVTALVTVMLPMISKNSKDNKYTSKLLYQTLLYTALLTIIVLIPLNIFNTSILNFIFGDKYVSAYQYMKYASVICLSYSLNMILLNYLVGVDKTKYIKWTLVIGVILLLVLLPIFSSSEYISLIIIAVINIVIFITNLLNIISMDRGGLKWKKNYQ